MKMRQIASVYLQRSPRSFIWIEGGSKGREREGKGERRTVTTQFIFGCYPFWADL